MAPENGSSAKSSTGNNTTNPGQKKFKTKEKIIHNFSAIETINVSPTILNDKQINKVFISNKKGTYRLLVDKKDLIKNPTLSVPISELNEKINIVGVK